MANKLRDELNELGKNITADAKKNALPNKKTGALDRSFNYEYTFSSNDKFNIVINQKYYGEYLNNKTHYMDNAIKNNLPNGVEDIINTIIGEIMNPITQIKDKK